MSTAALHVAVLIVLLTQCGRCTTDSLRCPRYCTCYLNSTDSMRSVSCVARRLDSIDLSIPIKVQSLDLSNNSISILEDRGFQNLGTVEIIKLVLKHNSIRTIGLHSFAGLIDLEHVDLAGNNLYQILPWTFHDNNNLKFISLSGNPLGHITSTGPFLDIPTLEVLELSSCNFAHFPEEAFSALPNLRKLDLSQNLLINFDIYTLQFLYNLAELDVSRNPWPCNTNLRNLKHFMSSKSSSLIGSTCDLSESLTEIEAKPVKFEKIISVGAVYPEYDGMNMNSDEEDSSEEVLIKAENKCNCKSESKSALFDTEHFILPHSWLILVSFQLGMCTTLFMLYFWTCCGKKKSKYQPLDAVMPIAPVLTDLQPTMTLPLDLEEGQQTLNSIDSNILLQCPETPPPSYRELYMSSSQRNP